MLSRSRSYKDLSIIFIGLIVGLGCIQSNEIKPKLREDGKRLCAQRSGHRSIQDANWRNNDCAVDCVMNQGVVLSYHVEDRTPCHSEGHYCLLGSCKGPDEYVKPKEELYNVEIRIISAYVEDKDLNPMAGASDVFIMVEVANGGSPTYKNNDDVCYTYVIQDNNRPKWKDFTCKPLPMSSKTHLRFSAFDSDKPFNEPDRLGFAEEDLSYLMNRGPTKLILVDWSSGSYSPYYVEVEVTGRPYELAQ